MFNVVTLENSWTEQLGTCFSLDSKSKEGTQGLLETRGSGDRETLSEVKELKKMSSKQTLVFF